MTLAEAKPGECGTDSDGDHWVRAEGGAWLFGCGGGGPMWFSERNLKSMDRRLGPLTKLDPKGLEGR